MRIRHERAVVAALIAASMSALGAGGAPADVSPDPALAADAMVLVVDFDFEPTRVTINTGDSVTWTVTGAAEPHTVSPLEPPEAFEGSAFLTDGDTFAATFAEPGTYRYVCLIHPEDMEGTVVVGAGGVGSSPAPPPDPTTSAPPTSAPTEIVAASRSPGTPGAVRGPLGDAGLVLVLLVLGSALALAGAWFWMSRRKGA